MNRDQLLAEEVPQAACLLGAALTQVDPGVAAAMLGGAIANMVGHIPDEFWEQMKIETVKPCECGQPECNGEAEVARRKEIYAMLDVLRNEWKEAVGDNPQEKGFTE